MKYQVNDFAVVSTEMDSQLFFNGQYQRAVEDSINRILSTVMYDAGMKLIAHKNYIVLQHGYEKHFDILDDYPENPIYGKKNMFVLAYIRR